MITSRTGMSSSIALLVAALLTSGMAVAADEGSAASPAAAAEPQAPVGQIPINPRHPDRYVVKKGDTLWDISKMFLQDPWYWPEIWDVNPQIQNPHLIYPGDVLSLAYDSSGKPQLRRESTDTAGSSTGAPMQAGGTEKLSPRVRSQDLKDAIPTIPLSVIGAFLTRGQVLEKREIRKLPYIMAIRENHLVGAAGNDLYVRGHVGGERQTYNVVHVGAALRDPDDGHVVGYLGLFVGDGTIRRGGDPATLFMNDSSREALKGDRLISQNLNLPAYFSPHPPAKPMEGSIIAVIDGVKGVAQYQIVVLNRGNRDGLEVGHVLRVVQRGARVRDSYGSGLLPSKVRLPDESAGLSMVFRTYDRVSYALIMEATTVIHVGDKVRNPT